MSDSKWEKLASDNAGIVDLGRPAVFYIPADKLDKTPTDPPLREFLVDYLADRFQGFSTSLVPSFGFYTSESGAVSYDECVVYEVSFVGKEGITELIALLAHLAAELGEDCIYFKAGEDACLVYPA